MSRRAIRCSKLALAALCLLSVQCGRVERTAECRRLTTTINQGLDEIAKLADTSPRDVSAISSRYQLLAEDVRALPVARLELLRAVEDYARLMEEAALAVDPSRPLPRPEAGRPKPRPELPTIVKRERTVVARIQGLCQSP